LKVLGVVPARMAASRFPEKPLALIHGIPMVGHCFFRSCLATTIDDVYVATCDQEIATYMRSVGGACVMTSDHHERASERTAEAFGRIEAETGETYDFVVLIQGDEPMLAPEMLDELVAPVRSGTMADVDIVNLVSAIGSATEFENRDLVKVVASMDGRALYFSREPIPSRRKYAGDVPMWRQLGMILFSRAAILAYPTLEPTPLEIIESVDMNRFLEYGWSIQLVPTNHPSPSVDSPEDLARVIAMMADDPVIDRYLDPQRML
jgi:3-deoxy-manno-octulosonate cytidylyltransferase (CMP-KDO synthetase)